MLLTATVSASTCTYCLHAMDVILFLCCQQQATFISTSLGNLVALLLHDIKLQPSYSSVTLRPSFRNSVIRFQLGCNLFMTTKEVS